MDMVALTKTWKGKEICVHHFALVSSNIFIYHDNHRLIFQKKVCQGIIYMYVLLAIGSRLVSPGC